MKIKDKNMDKQDWLLLITKYFDAETTAEEELLLKRFLASNEASDEEFNEVKAVMGFCLVGKAHYQPIKRVSIIFSNQFKIIAAACAFFILFSSVSLWMIDRRENVCIAYINGKKCTDSDLVMQEVQRSLADIEPPESEMFDLEYQLKDIFETISTTEE